jgi:hypothetical protein
MTSGAAAQEPPAPAGPKNLKVLPKNWTLPQVRALMQTFNLSLGVECSYCHAPDPAAPAPAPGGAPRLDYTVDTKDEKDIARTMIRMLMVVNGDYLKNVGDPGTPEKVTCYTCHAGAAVPASVPDAGWGRGGFSLLPAGPPLPARGGGAGRGN